MLAFHPVISRLEIVNKGLCKDSGKRMFITWKEYKCPCI